MERGYKTAGYCEQRKNLRMIMMIKVVPGDADRHQASDLPGKKKKGWTSSESCGAARKEVLRILNDDTESCDFKSP